LISPFIITDANMAADPAQNCTRVLSMSVMHGVIVNTVLYHTSMCVCVWYCSVSGKNIYNGEHVAIKLVSIFCGTCVCLSCCVCLSVRVWSLIETLIDSQWLGVAQRLLVFQCGLSRTLIVTDRCMIAITATAPFTGLIPGQPSRFHARQMRKD